MRAKKYHLEYRYPDGCNGVYPMRDLGSYETYLLHQLLDTWGLPQNDHPSEVAIVFEEN